MTKSKLRFYVCRECGPKGLYTRLSAMKEQLAKDGIQIELYHSICLSACKFNRIVKVQMPDGQLISYSDKDMNGFRKWTQDPMVQLTHECMTLTPVT